MFEIIREQSLASTNSYALELLRDGKILKPTILVANSQSKGRGQAENKWYSKEGESLTFSVILFPKNITAERQFTLSQVVCLALCKTLSKHTKNVAIKWPNDIFINGIKCCGVLIENALMGMQIAQSVCGIGLNVNNLVFTKGYRATSLKKETNTDFDLAIILNEFLTAFEHLYEKAEKGNISEINQLYHKHLYKLNKTLNFEDRNGNFSAKIIGIDQYGQLLLQDEDEQLRTYGFKEVRWLL